MSDLPPPAQQDVISSHPCIAELRRRRKQEREAAADFHQRLEKWTEEYALDLKAAAVAMEALRAARSDCRPKGFTFHAWVDPLLNLGRVVGKRGWQSVIRGYTGHGAVPELAELVCLVADGECDRDALGLELKLLEDDGELTGVDWQYPLDEWSRGILAQFAHDRSLTFPDHFPRPTMGAAGVQSGEGENPAAGTKWPTGPQKGQRGGMPTVGADVTPAPQERHPDGPDGDCWVRWKGARYDVPRGNVFRLIQFFWCRDSASYDSLDGSSPNSCGVFLNGMPSNNQIRTECSATNKYLKLIDVGWCLKVNSTDRIVTKQVGKTPKKRRGKHTSSRK